MIGSVIADTPAVPGSALGSEVTPVIVDSASGPEAGVERGLR